MTVDDFGIISPKVIQALNKIKSYRTAPRSHQYMLILGAQRKRMVTDNSIWVNFRKMLDWKPGDKSFNYPSVYIRQPVCQWR